MHPSGFTDPERVHQTPALVRIAERDKRFKTTWTIRLPDPYASFGSGRTSPHGHGNAGVPKEGQRWVLADCRGTWNREVSAFKGGTPPGTGAACMARRSL